MTGVFVYGTLKRGQCRESLWPRPPLAVETAYIRGRLFALAEYPALWCGDSDSCLDESVDSADDWIAGELWKFAPGDLEETVARLDQIEETNQPGIENLYDRIVVRAYRQPGPSASQLAFAYQFSRRSSLLDDNRMQLVPDREAVEWPPG